jgi:hydroxyacylglutathione hydrolase
VSSLAEVTPGVLVRTSDRYRTTSTAIAGAEGGCLLIDPAVTVEDLRSLEGALAAAGLRPLAGFATHAHWDHVLWSAGLGDVPRYATGRAAAAAARERSALVASVEAEAPGHELDLVARLTPLDAAAEAGAAGAAPQHSYHAGARSAVKALPWDGPEALVLAHDAHAPGHGAIFLPAAGLLVAGDMCSDIEMPLLDLGGADPVGDYRVGLERLAGLDVRVVIPGHGTPGDGAEFRRRVEADLEYLEALERGADDGDPRPAAGGWLLAEHQRQLRFARSR